MIWVCRAGNRGTDNEYFIEKQKVFLSWEGYRHNLTQVESMTDAKKIVLQEKPDSSKTAISTWASQIIYFVKDMEIDDLVFVPSVCSRDYCLCRLLSEYRFSSEDKYCHYREMEVIKEHIEKSVFSQKIINSLGAYRSVFKVGSQDEVLSVLYKEKILSH